MLTLNFARLITWDITGFANRSQEFIDGPSRYLSRACPDSFQRDSAPVLVTRKSTEALYPADNQMLRVLAIEGTGT